MTERAKRMASVVVLDGRDDPHAAEVTAAIAEALVATGAGDEPGEEAERDSHPSHAGGTAAVQALSDADAAVVLDPDSLETAREAGVPFCAVVFPGFDLGFAGELADADRVIVAHESLVDEVVRRGAPRGIVDVAGPVPPLGWAPNEDVAGLREELGLPTDVKLVLVPADALEEWGQETLMVQLSLVSGEVGFLFDVGTDAEVAGDLRELVPLHGLRAWMFADTPGAERYWQCADLVLGRARGHEIARALGVGAPLVLLPPGRTAAYAADALEATGAADEADVVATLAVALDSALDAEAWAAAKKAVAALASSEAAGRVAGRVRDAWDRRAEGRPSLPRGLPHGLEALGAEAPEPAPEEASAEPRRRSTDDMEARIDRELEELKKRL